MHLIPMVLHFSGQPIHEVRTSLAQRHEDGILRLTDID